MLTRHDTRCLLRPEDLPPSSDAMRVIGAFNCGAAATGKGDEVVLLVRVCEQPVEQRAGYVGVPYWKDGGIVLRWEKEIDYDITDPRVITRKSDDRGLLRFISYLRVVRLPDGRSVGSLGPTMMPETPYETFGLEDPRITPIDGRFFITYVGVSGNGVVTALASTDDFETFERRGVIFCPENKDVMLFPYRVAGRFVALHRPTMSFQLTAPQMWLADSPDLLHWGNHRVLLGPGGPVAGEKIGGGCPPILTDRGYLVIYHAAVRHPGEPVARYSAVALLLDAENPDRILAHSPGALFAPTEPFEREGFVPNVVFPTGVVPRGDRLLVYYGAADDKCGVTELSLRQLLDGMVDGPPR